ncbi:MAG: DMT family transporter [Pseudomonadales bacterium]
MLSKSLRADLILLLVAAVWGFSLVAQHIGLDYLGPLGFNAARFALGTAVLLPLLFFVSRSAWQGSRQLLIKGCLAGLVLFMGSSFQQAGLQYTTAGNAGFITSMYIVFVPVFALAVAQKTGINTWIGGALALVGLYLLSVSEALTINRGDLLILIGAAFWALHVLLIDKFAMQFNNLLLSLVQFAFCAVLGFVLALIWEGERTTVTNMLDAWQPLLFAGVLTVGIGHSLQVVGQRDAVASHAAIIMSLEALFAALGGWLWLDEQLSTRQFAGCALMLAGVLLSQFPIFGKRAPAALS